MTQAGLHSGASPFPSGLRLFIRASGIEEMQEKAAFWRVHTTQLEPGGYRGSIRAIHTALMQLGLSVRSNSTKIEGSPGTIPRARPAGFRGLENPESRAPARRECHNRQRSYRGYRILVQRPPKDHHGCRERR